MDFSFYFCCSAQELVTVITLSPSCPLWGAHLPQGNSFQISKCRGFFIFFSFLGSMVCKPGGSNKISISRSGLDLFPASFASKGSENFGICFCSSLTGFWHGRFDLTVLSWCNRAVSSWPVLELWGWRWLRGMSSTVTKCAGLCCGTPGHDPRQGTSGWAQIEMQCRRKRWKFWLKSYFCSWGWSVEDLLNSSFVRSFFCILAEKAEH